MPTTTELREESRRCLEAAKANKTRWSRHKQARRALELARLAAKIERGESLSKTEQALTAAIGKPADRRAPT
jgi:hypothetical protein